MCRRFGWDEQTVSSHSDSQPVSLHIPMGPNQRESRRLFTSSPRNQDPPPVHLLDEDLRRDLEEQEQLQHYRQQQQQGEGADIEIVGEVFGPNEDQEVRTWKMVAGNVRW